MIHSKFPLKIESFIRKTLRVPFLLHVYKKRVRTPYAPTYVLIHGLADSGALWHPLLKHLPKDANYIVVDLVGHGQSPMTSAAVYSAEYQARNVIATCIAARCVGPYVFVGHSFGSIVAVECARRYPRTQQLILCSLPLYHTPTRAHNPREPESMLFEVYRQAMKHPKDVVAAYRRAGQLKLSGASKITLSEETFPAFVQTLKAGIINQKTAVHLAALSIPTTIIYGRFDPVVIGKNLRAIARTQSNITIVPLINDHALRPVMVRAVVHAIHHP